MLDCDCNCSSCFRNFCSLDLGSYDFVDGVPVDISEDDNEDFDCFLKGEKNEDC